MNRQAQIKAEQIARMIVKGMKGTRIAVELGMSYDGVQRILRHPEYLKIESEVRTGVLSKMDARLDKRASMSEEVEDAIPDALAVLLDAVKKKRDLKASLELLDRDPNRQFAKNKQSTIAAQPPATPTLGLSDDALNEVMKQADITHNILQSPGKPAEA